MKITAHFSLSEFKCKDGTEVPEEFIPRIETLAVQLEQLRAHFGGVPIRIISAYRNFEYNKRCGGTQPEVKDGTIVEGTGSQHLWARAVDISVRGIDPKSVAEACADYQESGDWIMGGVGCYPNHGFTHIDTRGHRARWTG